MKKKRPGIFSTFTELNQGYAASAVASATGLLTGMYTGSGYEAYYYDSEGREVQRYATGYNRGRRCTAYNYDGTIASRTYSYRVHTAIKSHTCPIWRRYTFTTAADD